MLTPLSLPEATSRAPAPAPSPVLIVVGGAPEPRRPAAIDAKWLAALPAASRVLAIGSDAIALAASHRSRCPDARWWGACLPQDDAADPNLASQDLEGVHSLAAWTHGEPLGDEGSASHPVPDFDLLVLGTGLAALPHAARQLAALSRHAQGGAQLVAALDNAAAASRIEHLLQADATPDDTVTDPAQPTQVPATVYKLLMDAGWMPTLVDQHACTPTHAKAGRALRFAAESLGVGPGSVDVVHRMRRLIIRAQRPFAQAPVEPGTARFCVVVPSNEERQLRANIEASPGLREVSARIVSVRQARSPAEALAQATPHCDTDWVLLCHQDVYFPTGFGEQLNAVLAGVPAAERRQTLIGFVGLGVDRSSHQPVPAGHVIDRLQQADHAASDAVLSMDEVAIVLSRDSLHQIDPAIGWHLWATDLCLTAIDTHRVFPRIVRLPLFHNSRTGWTLPPAFLAAAERLLAKHPGYAPIHTLCGTLDAAFIAHHQKATP